MSSNPVVVLTGAASGIGAALLPLLVRERYQVVASDLSSLPENEEYRSFSCDVSDHKQVDRLFDFAIEQFGRIDIFIANAGFAYFEKTKTADWERTEKIYKVNTISPIYSTHKMKALHGSQPFQVMITASAMSHWPLPGYAQYASTKAALHAFAATYRHELDQGQHLQLVYPIGTRTSFFDRADHSPKPLMTQSAEHVARAMLKGIRSKQKAIYPSLIFQAAFKLNRIFPIFKSIAVAIEKRSFKKWVELRWVQED
ncbi:MAG: SDR family NAD(P)-dependent oxidoreductase [Cyclobacteriaceae bacterium]